MRQPWVVAGSPVTRTGIRKLLQIIDIRRRQAQGTGIADKPDCDQTIC